MLLVNEGTIELMAGHRDAGAPGLRGGPGAGPAPSRARTARSPLSRSTMGVRTRRCRTGGPRWPPTPRSSVRSSRWAWRRRAPAGFRKRGHVLASLRTGRRRSVTGRRSRRRGRGWRGILRPRAAGRGAADTRITRNTGRGIRGSRGIQAAEYAEHAELRAAEYAEHAELRAAEYAEHAESASGGRRAEPVELGETGSSGRGHG